MATGPGLFSDIGKKAKDLLAKDYVTDQKFSVSTLSNTGLAITSSAVKNGGLSTGQVAAIYPYKNSLINVQVDTASNILTSFIIKDILPSTKTMASFILPDYTSGKLEVQYFHHHGTLTTSATLNKNPIINLSATLGTPTISFGAEAGYDTTSRYVTKYTAGISVTKPECCASIILGEKGDTITASYLHHLDESSRSTVVGEFNRKFSTNENTFTVGGSYAIDSITVAKAKLNNHGKLGAALQHELMPKSILTLAGDFDTKALDRNPRFGVAFALSP
ncbi:hypothetical protein V2J09_009838 [Rumex salicifolius]